MKPALQVHNELEKYLANKDVCFNEEQYIDIATKHLKNPERVKNILRKNVLTVKNVYNLTEYPYGIMFIEIGGHFETDSTGDIILYKDFQRSCWDGQTKKPYLLHNQHVNDWHLHPWNLMGYGHPPFFSLEDINDACQNKKRKLLYVGNPYYYNWPRAFLLDMTNCDQPEQTKNFLYNLVHILNTGTPYIDPKIDWSAVQQNLAKFGANLHAS